MRVWSVGVAMAAWCVAASVRAEPLRLDLGVAGGWNRIADARETPVLGGDTESDARFVLLGLSARVFPYRRLVAELGYEGGRASVEVEDPRVTPRETSVRYGRLGLAVGWLWPLARTGRVRDIATTVGYARRRWDAEPQQPTQLTPSFTHDELRVAGEVSVALAQGAAEATFGLTLVPYLTVEEEHATDGSEGTGWGASLVVRGAYDLGPLLGRWGHVWAGAAFEWDGRRIAYEGTGTRRTLAGREVADVDESFSRLAFLVTATWRLGGDGRGGARGEGR